MADKIGRFGVTLAMSILIARHLGPKGFGELNYATAFVALFMPLATFGLDRILVRDFIRSEVSPSVILGTSLAWRIVGGGVILSLATLLSIAFMPEDKTVHILVSILSLAPILQSAEVVDYWFQSRLESKYVAISKAVSLFGSTILRLGLLLFDSSVIGFAVASLTESLFLSIALLVAVYKKKICNEQWKVSRDYAATLLHEGWPLALNLAFHVLYLRISLITVASIMGDSAVGLFSAASRLYDGIIPFFSLLSTSLFPFLIKSYDEDREAFFNRYGKISRLLSGIGWIACLALALLSPIAVPKLYGSEYQDSGVVLSILAIGLVFQLSSLPRAAYLTVTRNQRTLLGISIASALMAIILNVLLIKAFGLRGAAAASVGATFFNFFVANYLFKATRPLAGIQLKSIIFLK